MLIEKEVIAPGQYWYTDEKTGLPHKLDVTPELTKYWHEQGSKMLSAGLTVPIPCEHDFTAHPMTPREKLLNNAGEVKEYRLKGDVLWSVCDIQDSEVKKKIGGSIRWTSPWITSFTDGQGKKWDNVIGHLALTTRPRVTKQTPFSSIAAALSIATSVEIKAGEPTPSEGYCISKAGRLVTRKRDKQLRPQYPIAFSMISGGIKLASDDSLDTLGDDGDIPDDTDDALDMSGLMNPTQDQTGDIAMEELLCDLLQALGVPMPDESNETEFKRHLYEAAMSKIKELTSKGMAGPDKSQMPDQNQPPGANPHAAKPNPLIQQEQQPMYMSLEEIHKLPDPMKSVALAMYNENVKLRSEVEASKKITDSLRDAKIKEASVQRGVRVALLGKLSPRVKADLDSMCASPSMALSMGEGGAVLDPMAHTLAMLEKGLSDMPRLLTSDISAFSVQPQPSDSEMSAEAIDKIADDFARMMGCPPERKAS